MDKSEPLPAGDEGRAVQGMSADVPDIYVAENTQKLSQAFAQEIFLAALASGASIAGAARTARRPRSSFYSWRRKDAAFAKAWAAAIEDGTDLLEDEAVRRALIGTSKPIYYGGKIIGQERRHSDQLLTLLLKARRPQKFDGSGAPDADITADPAQITAELENRLSRLLAGSGDDNADITEGEDHDAAP